MSSQYEEDADLKTDNLMNKQGVIVGCDEYMEWLLPFWWHNYSLHNSYPVLFYDFGMSEKARSWCREKGSLQIVDCPENFLQKKESIDPKLIEKWEGYYSAKALWQGRNFWFLKPLASAQSPFQQTMWIDVDCEILVSLAPVFAVLDEKITFGVCPATKSNREHAQSAGFIEKDSPYYQAGVYAFSKNSPIIKEWAQRSLSENHLYLSDQILMTEILLKNKKSFKVLDITYNWQLNKLGISPEAKIIHYCGITKNKDKYNPGLGF